MKRFKAGVAVIALLAVAPSAQAGWREDIGTFRIGVVAEPGAGATLPGASTIEAAYGRLLGMRVNLFVARDYAALVDAQASGRLEYAVYSALAYAAAARFCSCVEPLAAPSGADGATGIRSVLIERRAAGAADADPATIATPGGDDVAGWLLPFASYEHQGRALSGEDDFVMDLATPQAAAMAFAEGRAGGLFGWMPAGSWEELSPRGGTFDRLAAMGVAADDLVASWRSDPLPFGPHAVRADLAVEAKVLLRDFLLTLKERDPDLYDLIEPERQGGFVRVKHDDYAPAAAILGRLAQR